MNIPRHKKDISLVLVEIYYMNYPGVHGILEQTRAYFKNIGVPVLFIGQTESYKLAYEKIVKLKMKYPSLIHEVEYINKESGKMNKLLKANLPEEQYIDLYLQEKIQKQGKESIYMFDDNHFTKYGADQAVKYLISAGLLRTVQQ